MQTGAALGTVVDQRHQAVRTARDVNVRIDRVIIAGDGLGDVQVPRGPIIALTA